MQLTSEEVHWLFGAALAAVAVLLLWIETRSAPRTWTRFVIPGVLLTSGVPPACDPLLDGAAAPGGYGAETAQHLVMGVVPLAVITGIGPLFVLHAQHDPEVPMRLLITQHRIARVTLWLVAAALALAELSPRLRPAFRVNQGRDRDRRALWRAPGPRSRRWTRTDRPALVQQRRRPPVRTSRGRVAGIEDQNEIARQDDRVRGSDAESHSRTCRRHVDPRRLVVRRKAGAA